MDNPLSSLAPLTPSALSVEQVVFCTSHLEESDTFRSWDNYQLRAPHGFSVCSSDSGGRGDVQQELYGCSPHRRDRVKKHILGPMVMSDIAVKKKR